MPTPMVKADTSTASALQTVGDTIASLGKSAQYVSEVQQRRAAAQESAIETAGQDAYQRWQQEADKRFADYHTKAAGLNIPKEKESFEQFLAGDAGEYVKGLSPEVATAFEKRRQFASQTYRNKADTLALGRTREFTVQTAANEVKDALREAGFAEAGGNIDVYTKSMGRAYAAAARADQITGNQTDQLALRSEALKIAADALVENGDPRKVVEFYNNRKGDFGAYETGVAAKVQDSLDTIGAQEYISQNATAFQDSDGRFTVPGDLADKLSTMPAGQAKHVAKFVAQAQQEYLDRSKKVSTALMDAYEDAAVRMQTDRFYSDENNLRAFVSLPEDMRQTVLAREDDIRQGLVGKSNPQVLAAIELALESSPKTRDFQWGMTDPSLLPLSGEDRVRVAKMQAKAAQSNEFTDKQKLDDIARKVFEEGGTRVPSIPKPGDSVDSKDKALLARFQEAKNFAFELLSDPSRKESFKSPQDIANAVAEAMRATTVYKPGVFSGQAETITNAQYLGYAPPTEEEAKAFGITADMSLPQRTQKVQIGRAKAQAEAMQKAAQEQADEEWTADMRRSEDDKKSWYQKGPLGAINRADEAIADWYRSLGIR
jgi:hypothetical protein